MMPSPSTPSLNMLQSTFLAPFLSLFLLGLPGQESAPDRQEEGDVVSQEQLEKWTEEILAEVAEIRGLEFKRPVTVATANGEEFMTYMKDRVEKSSSQEENLSNELVAKLLGVIPHDMPLMETYMSMVESQVGGFYDPEIEGFFLMERFGGDAARIILSHELTHALDDQHYDIDGTLEGMEGNSDAAYAYHAVVEGSGSAIMNAWIMQRITELNLLEVMQASSAGAEDMAEAPPFLWKPLVSVYLKGADFLVRSKGMLAVPTQEDLHAAFTSPPRSSEQILHPEKYWNPDKRDEPQSVSFDTGSLPSGWRLAFEDTLGEMGLGLVVEPLKKRKGMVGQAALLTARFTTRASEGWGGDRYLLMEKDGAHLFLLETFWDSEKDAREFQAAVEEQEDHLARSLEGLAVARGQEAFGRDLQLNAEEARVTVRAWLGASEDEAQVVFDSIPMTVGR